MRSCSDDEKKTGLPVQLSKTKKIIDYLGVVCKRQEHRATGLACEREVTEANPRLKPERCSCMRVKPEPIKKQKQKGLKKI